MAAAASAALALGLAAPSVAAADITPPVTVVVSPDYLTQVPVGDAALLSSSAEDSAGAPVPVESWQYSTSESGTYADISGTTGLGDLALAAVSISDDGWYRAAFPDGSGGRVFSSPGQVDVGLPPTVTTPTGPASVSVGSTFTLTTTVGGDEPVGLVWQSAPSASGPWAVLEGATDNPQSITAPLTAGVTTYYRVQASSPFGESTSGAVTVTTYDGLVPPSTVAAVNNAPNKLTVSWTGGGATGITYGYAVELVMIETSAVTTRSVSASPAVFTDLPAGTYQVRVKTTTAPGDSAWTQGNTVTVASLVQSATLSSSMLRPFKDGYQDTIALKASSNFPASGSVKIRNSAGSLVRAVTLTSGTSWSIAFDGRTASGTRLAFGGYTAQFILGGVVVATKAFTIASSQVGYPSATWSETTVYPATDGYRDTAVLATRTTIPATVTVVILNSSNQKVYSKSLSRRFAANFTWTGRSSSTGAILPAGQYKAKITVKGGEGTARSAVRAITLSKKKITAVSFSGTITAENAYDATVEGDYETGFDAGSLALWSSPYLGDTIHTFSAALPSSFGNRYSGLKVYGCGYSYSGGNAALLRLDDEYNTYSGWVLGSSEGCYGGSWSSSLVNGRTIYMAVGNVGQDYTYYYLLGFKVTGTRYVLK